MANQRRGIVANYSLVQAGFGAPRRQNRWTVAFRFIVALPHVFWVFVRGIAAFIIVFIGWFAALFMGRLPHSFARALSNYLIYQTRVSSYLSLMNDTYPPFSTTADFDVNLDIPVSDVRRWAVFFRWILLIPANLVNGIVSLGLSVGSVIIWLIVLVKGEMPSSLFGALSAVLRFQARTNAYAFMITGKYPGELFGEQSTHSDVLSETRPTLPMHDVAVSPAPPSIESDASASKASVTDPVTSSTPEYVHDSGFADTPDPPAGDPVGFMTNGSATDSVEAPRTAGLVLSQGAKRILVVFLVLGALSYAAYGVVYVTVLRGVAPLTSLENANTVLANKVIADKTLSGKCTLGQNACLQQYYAHVSIAFYGFEQTISLISFPSSAKSDATRLLNDTAGFYSQLNQMSRAGTTITRAQTNRLQAWGVKYDSAYAHLIADLSPAI